MVMTIEDSERYLRLMLGGMEYAVRYWKDRDKEESDIEKTNVEAVKTALDTMNKYQKIEQIIKDHDNDRIPEDYWYIDKIKEILEDRNDENVLVGCVGCKYSGFSKCAVCDSCINMNRYKQEVLEDDYCWNGDSREKHCPLVEAIPKDNVYKAIQEIMKYEHEGFININLARLDEILKKCEVSE